MGYVNQHCKPRALIALDQVVLCIDGKPGVNQGQKCRILIGLFFFLLSFVWFFSLRTDCLMEKKKNLKGTF